MAYLLSFNDPTPLFEPPQPHEAPLPPIKGISHSRKSALVVGMRGEYAKELLRLLKHSLREGYAVRTAKNCEEGLRLYHDFPFHIVLIDYCVPQTGSVVVDFLMPQTTGVGFAMAIREINPAQSMIIAAFSYQNAEEVQRPSELMNIPVLVDIRNLRNLVKRLDVDRAIDDLTRTDWLRLRRSADFRILGLGRAARGRTGHDLLDEALVRTLMGTEPTENGRHYNKNVHFVRYLTEAMRSIANSWKRTFHENEAYLASEVLRFDGKAQTFSLDNVASAHLAADERLIAKERGPPRWGGCMNQKLPRELGDRRALGAIRIRGTTWLGS